MSQPTIKFYVANLPSVFLCQQILILDTIRTLHNLSHRLLPIMMSATFTLTFHSQPVPSTLVSMHAGHNLSGIYNQYQQISMSKKSMLSTVRASKCTYQQQAEIINAIHNPFHP